MSALPKRLAFVGGALLLLAAGFIALVADRVLIVVNGPGIGTALLLCGFREQGKVRTCGSDEFGVVMEEERTNEGAITRHWYPGGTEYFREIGTQATPTKILYRAVLPCWLGKSIAEARGPPQGMEAIACIDGVGMGPTAPR